MRIRVRGPPILSFRIEFLVEIWGLDLRIKQVSYFHIIAYYFVGFYNCDENFLRTGIIPFRPCTRWCKSSITDGVNDKPHDADRYKTHYDKQVFVERWYHWWLKAPTMEPYSARMGSKVYH